VKRWTVAPLLAIAALLLTSSTASAIGTKEAAQQYLEDVASTNTALHTFDTQIQAWTNSTADIQGEREAALTLAVLRTLRKNLLSQTWPQFVKGDVQFIGAEDISSLEEDLRMIDSNSSLGNGAFQFTFAEDSRTLDYDAFYVRKDLGLPRGRAL
jgi:hypothetical protein